MIMFAVLLLPLTRPVQAGVTITLHAEAQVEGAYIRLGELGSIRHDVEDHPVAAHLHRLFVGPAPRPGESQVIGRERIRTRMRELGFDEPVRFLGTPYVTISRRPTEPVLQHESSAPGTSSATHSPSDTPSTNRSPVLPLQDAHLDTEHLRAIGFVADAIRRHIQGGAGGEGIRVQVQVQSVESILTPHVARMDMLSTERGQIPGHATVRLACKDGAGRTLMTATAVVQVRMYAPVVTPRRQIQAGETVQAEDLLVHVTELRTPTFTPTFDPADVEGLQAIRPLMANQPVVRGDFLPPVEVRQGASVMAHIRSGSLTITERVTALSDGRRGESIPVESGVGKNRYPAVVTGPGTVEARLK